LPSAVGLAAPAVFCCIGTSHQDYRFRRGEGGVLTPELEAKTSNIPFFALLTGAQSWSELANEMKWVNAGLAVSVAALIHMRRWRVIKAAVW
jgi:uncharacterized membrane protein